MIIIIQTKINMNILLTLTNIFDDLIDNETIYVLPPKIFKLTEVSKPDNFEKILPSPVSDLEKHEKEFNEIQE
jgi:hypothetical protein